jgi:ATP-dependent HslUV protease ATP-binding subunit HslU
MLFIAAGAFHVAKVSDLIPELQGRFPVQVTLKSLSKEDFVKILTQPDNALTLQYQALLAADKVYLSFQEEALEEIAQAACNLNDAGENIGARRLHAVFEELLEDISFHAGGEDMPRIDLEITAQYVQEHVKAAKKTDLRKYIM